MYVYLFILTILEYFKKNMKYIFICKYILINSLVFSHIFFLYRINLEIPKKTVIMKIYTKILSKI